MSNDLDPSAPPPEELDPSLSPPPPEEPDPPLSPPPPEEPDPPLSPPPPEEPDPSPSPPEEPNPPPSPLEEPDPSPSPSEEPDPPPSPPEEPNPPPSRPEEPDPPPSPPPPEEPDPPPSPPPREEPYTPSSLPPPKESNPPPPKESDPSLSPLKGLDPPPPPHEGSDPPPPDGSYPRPPLPGDQPRPPGGVPSPPKDVLALPSLPPQANALSPSALSNSSGSRTAVVVGGAIGGMVLLILPIAMIFILVYRRRRGGRRLPPPGTPADFFYEPRKPASTPLQQLSHAPSSTPSVTPPLMQSWQSGGSGSSHGSSLPAALMSGTFTYDELAAATDGFSEANLLGQGGFGHVYKGTVRGQEVAIKKLRDGSGQGHREFRAEVDIISRVHHKNLVSLIGFCIHDEQRLLVYEYVPNNTLHAHLHPGSGRPALDWPRRWKIAVGSAKGIAYLHEDCHPKIIHRDIKAANILLDYSFEPKVADFGLAKCQEAEHTTVSTRVMGTYGYLAPEYAATGKVSDRSDVFSFGVMLLELITGKKPAVKFSDHDEPETLVSWARPLLARAVDEGNYEELIDPTLEANYDAYDMTRLVACAAAAVRHTARSRPRMTQIVRYLEGELSPEDLNAGMAPGRSAMQRSATQGSGNTDDDVKCLGKMAVGAGATGTGTVGGDCTSSEMSEPTSEYTASGGVDTAVMRTGATTGMNDAEVGRSHKGHRQS